MAAAAPTAAIPTRREEVSRRASGRSCVTTIQSIAPPAKPRPRGGASGTLRRTGRQARRPAAVPGVHKTEPGGVALGLAGADDVREAAERIGCPVIVQTMVSGATELLAGVTQDSVFGPLVAFGPGGTMAELIGEAGFRIAPLTDVDADELVSTGKAGRLVRGYRGAPASDEGALTDVLHRLSRLGEDFPGGGRARPESGHRRAGGVRCGRCTSTPSPAPRPAQRQDLVGQRTLG